MGILLEEAQRFLFGRFLEAGLRSLERLVAEGVSTLAKGEWERLEPQRSALAGVLVRMPAEPFLPTSENAACWLELINKARDPAGGLPAAGFDDPEGGALLRKYLAGAEGVDPLDRVKVLRLIESLVAGPGSVAYLLESMHGARSPMAQRIVIARQADLESKVALARRLLGIRG